MKHQLARITDAAGITGAPCIPTAATVRVFTFDYDLHSESSTRLLGIGPPVPSDDLDEPW